jgi:tRNA (mo5U34)-methyltransferase
MSLIPKLDTRRSERLGDRTIMDAFLKEEISRRKWYHSMDLGNGVTTPGVPYDSTWNNTRKARSAINYTEKAVLDLGSWDGMWAFEAEMLGASLVVATDCLNYWQLPDHHGMNNLILVREAIFSQVVPLWNISPYVLRDRLDNMLYSHPLLKDGFDIVQHLGLFYHLRDPLLSLAQCRSVIKEAGTLLIETAIHDTEDSVSMLFNFGKDAFYKDDLSTWWAPTLPCLREILRMSYFEMDEGSVTLLRGSSPVRRALLGGSPVCRAALRATAVPPGKGAWVRYNLDPAVGHGFGEHIIRQVLPDAPR